MIRVLVYITVVSALGCGSATESKRDPLSLDLRLYPAGVEADLRYTITVAGDSITATNYRPSHGGNPTVATRALRPAEQDSLTQLAGGVTDSLVTVDTSKVRGAWGATLLVAGKPVYRAGQFSFENPPPQVKGLLGYLRGLSGLSIDLYSFS